MADLGRERGVGQEWSRVWSWTRAQSPKKLFARHPIELTFFALVAVVLMSWWMAEIANDAEVEADASAYPLLLPVGFQREKVTATLLVNLCAPSSSSGLDLPDQPECRDTATAPPTTSDPAVTTVSGAAPAVTSGVARPAILSTTLSGDLRLGNSARFSSTDVTVAAVNEGRDGLKITVTADPTVAEDLDAGLYDGRVVVQRELGNYVSVPVGMAVNDTGKLTWPSLWWLFFGGLAGLIVKWFTDSGAPVAKSYRRLRRVRRLIPARRREVLSEDVASEFDDASEDLGAFDTAAVEIHLARLESNASSLIQVARVLEYADDLRRRLLDMGGPGLDGNGAILEARDRIAFAMGSIQRREHIRPWPWDDAAARTEIIAGYSLYDHSLIRIDELIGGVASGDRLPQDTFLGIAAQIFVGGSDVLMQLDVPSPSAETLALLGENATTMHTLVSGSGARSARPSASKRSRSIPDPHSDAEALARSLSSFVSPILAIGFLVALVIAGYMTEVASNNSFSGGFGENLKLWVWSFGVAVTGGTLATLVGQVSQVSKTAPAPPKG